MWRRGVWIGHARVAEPHTLAAAQGAEVEIIALSARRRGRLSRNGKPHLAGLLDYVLIGNGNSVRRARVADDAAALSARGVRPVISWSPEVAKAKFLWARLTCNGAF